MVSLECLENRESYPQLRSAAKDLERKTTEKEDRVEWNHKSFVQERQSTGNLGHWTRLQVWEGSGWFPCSASLLKVTKQQFCTAAVFKLVLLLMRERAHFQDI